ncbi:hypothetical protein IQ276_006855 [Desmonostoc muscorum LEGE 12446]|uniref:Uncharacterized protein n=1 Tax=Desmonostoc muscorum LEGE 12446 TaxID=1828758 RepID=A0A8J7DG05_DESMC|nr:hypothetical protein [Desmonostoc muscorum]MCF2146173.1 hypothetical protein [Desmonostoc muscorum LEGE 12446]
MLGKDYFTIRLGDIYEYSRVQYKFGEGISNKNAKYLWELCVDVSGNIIFVLSSKESLHFLEHDTNVESFSGTSDDEVWEISCTDIKILTTKVEVSYKSTWFCLPSAVVLKLKVQPDNIPTLARAYFSNFNFSSVDCERGFFVNLNGKKLCFQMLENSNRLIDLIDIERINNAIVSTVSIPINYDEDINVIENEVQAISWFLSFLSMNTNFSPVIEYLMDDKIVQYSIENTVKNCFSRTRLIDNYHIHEGITKAFNECYQHYKNLQSSMDINTIIGLLVEIKQQKYIDLKIASMLMAYEKLTLKYLLSQGLDENKIGNNIEQKLGTLNTHLDKFIPKNIMINNDKLRNSIRNPLFHQGEIPKLTLDEKINFFKDYFDLLIKIILKILKYNGEYISVKTHRASKV